MGVIMQEIADLLYPGAKPVSFWEEKFPRRNLNAKQEVTRYAPSPTGFMHIGNFFQMFLSYNLARNSDGVFIKRLEDTDAKRENKDAFGIIKAVMDRFNIIPDEYQEKGEEPVGNYGPYIQSLRKDIYASYAKELVTKGKAFPCFCKATTGKEEIFKAREEKFAVNDDYEYDPCRDLTVEEVKKHLENGDKFAIRLKTSGTGKERVKFIDLIKGEIEAQANAKDVILMKQDGIPPYTFAHIIDDYLMGVTTVVRGEEYIASTPVHIEIVNALGFKPFRYCHNPLICKIPENGNKRKISKRYDPEANMMYYFEKGYPKEAVLEYLLNLLSSSFEPWRAQNPQKSWKEFEFTINDITAVSPILDMVKLNDMAKNVVSRLSASQVYDYTLAWAEEYDADFVKYLKENKDYCTKVFNIDRETPKPRKDIYMWSMIKDKDCFGYMFEEPTSTELDMAEKDNYNEAISEYAKIYHKYDTKEEWFAGVKALAERLGYATDNKLYKANPQAFKGNTAKLCEYIRLAITGKKNAPDLYEIMTILGEDKVLKRLANLK